MRPSLYEEGIKYWIKGLHRHKNFVLFRNSLYIYNICLIHISIFPAVKYFCKYLSSFSVVFVVNECQNYMINSWPIVRGDE